MKSAQLSERVSFRFKNLLRDVLNEDRKYRHITHIEDLVYLDGRDGVESALKAFETIKRALSGHSDKNLGLTVKWDGAPSIVCGTDPSDGRFFVAKKSAFNKTPKIYKSPEEVKMDNDGELAYKLIEAFKYLKLLNIKGIIQGDLMFTKKSKKIMKIHGRRHVVFHPNTLLYAYPLDSDEGEMISDAQFGIVFHTKFVGDSISTMQPAHTVDDSDFSAHTRVWARTANLEIENAEQIGDLDTHINAVRRLVEQTQFEFLEKPMGELLVQYHNSLIRSRDMNKPVDEYVNGFAGFLKQKNPQLSQRVTQDIKNVVEIHKHLEAMKDEVINKLNDANDVDVYVRSKTGYMKANPEGYIIRDKNNNPIKLVSRTEFSLYNFDKDFKKGWKKKK